MSKESIIMLVTMVLYLGMMIFMGIRYSNKMKSSSDFYLGGRRLGPFVTAMSAEASDMSSWLLMGLPAVALMTGLPEAVWTAIGLAIGTYLNWLFVAKRLRVYSSKLESFTLPDFFAKRFGDKSRVLTTVAALIIIIFFIPYTASGFAACGKLFSSLFGMDYMLAMILSAIVITLYCTLGGFLAASTTDFIQSIVMTAALLFVVIAGASFAGGFGDVFSNVGSLEGFTNLFKGFDVKTGTVSKYGALTIASTLAWGLGYFGMPHILVRFMGIKEPKKLKLSRRVASGWVVVSMGVAILIGVIGFSLRKNGVVPFYADSSSAETVLVDFANFISKKGIILALFGGLILSGILASTMSTADSQLLAASSSISQNLVQETFGAKLSNKTSMILARVSVIVIAAVSVFLARDPSSSVFKIVSFAWAGFGAAFGPVMLLSLFWKRTNKFGAIAGVLAGGTMVFVWKFVIRKAFADTILNIYELLPAFLVSLVVIVVVSLLTPKPADDVTSTFEDVKAECKLPD